MPEPLADALQESVLAVIAFDKKYGAIVASQVTPEHFNGVYHEIASAVLGYQRKYNKAPGRAHLESLFPAAKLSPNDRKTQALRRTLVALAAQADTLNAEYVTSRVQGFVRYQKLGTALLEANERYVEGGDEAVQDVEGILNGALRFRQTTLDAGTYLRDVTRSSVFQEAEEDDAIAWGIPELDKYRLGPRPKQMLLYIGPKNSGKTWACVHMGRQGLLQRKRVLHVSCEMDEQQVLDRYYQSFFGISVFDERYERTTLDLDELGRLIGFKTRSTKPRLSFQDPKIKQILRKKVQPWGARFGRLVIKSFPSGTLTMAQLRGYIDYLEQVEKFEPDELIVDYPDIMKQDHRDLRLSLGRTFVELRGLAQERNMSLFVPTQSGRDSIGARQVQGRNVTEDISKVFTADVVLTFSQTAAEATRGLGRLLVDFARQAPKGMQVLLTQSYSTGQYVTGSALVRGAYWDELKRVAGDDAATAED